MVGKITVLSIASLVASAAAFAPESFSRRNNLVRINAEKSASLPFLNRPPLVSFRLDWKNAGVVF